MRCNKPPKCGIQSQKVRKAETSADCGRCLKPTESLLALGAEGEGCCIQGNLEGGCVVPPNWGRGCPAHPCRVNKPGGTLGSFDPLGDARMPREIVRAPSSGLAAFPGPVPPFHLFAVHLNAFKSRPSTHHRQPHLCYTDGFVHTDQHSKAPTAYASIRRRDRFHRHSRVPISTLRPP